MSSTFFNFFHIFYAPEEGSNSKLQSRNIFEFIFPAQPALFEINAGRFDTLLLEPFIRSFRGGAESRASITNFCFWKNQLE